jgi:hypothetical protein
MNFRINQDHPKKRVILRDNPCVSAWGSLYILGGSFGIPWQILCHHFNMLRVFFQSRHRIISSSWTKEYNVFFLYFVQVNLVQAKVNIILSFLFFSKIGLMRLFFNWVCCFPELYLFFFFFFFQNFKLLLILTLVDISQRELSYFGMKYRSWRR